MRLASFTVDNVPTAAALTCEGWRSLGATMEEAVRLPRERLERLAAAGVQIPARARRLAPLRPRQIVAIGLNYADHVREAGLEPPAEPLVIGKLPSSMIGPEAAIEVDARVTLFVDWEVELAVVIGARSRDVPESAALSHVFGFTVANDVSARDLQQSEGQWLRAKSLDTFCPLGPELVTADAIPDPQQLRLWTEVNGERVQDGSTADMIFGVAELIAFCSRSFTLEPGDLLLTGTPHGVGMGHQPPRSLAPGDRIACSIERIGVLENPSAVRPA